MPKETFHNLPDEKRENIESVAIDEFAEYGFDGASINRIVENCGIAKGSFYQYFEDKRDLFMHIMGLIGQEKIKYVTPVMQNPQGHDFFTLIKEIYASGMKFATANIKLANIGNQLLKNIGSQMYRDLIRENVYSATKFFEDLLELAISRGEVRADIDVKYISHMLMSLTISNFEYWLETREGRPFDMAEYSEAVGDIVDRQLDFVKNGIGLNAKEV